MFRCKAIFFLRTALIGDIVFRRMHERARYRKRLFLDITIFR